MLEQCYDQVDLLSLHQYFAKAGDDSYDFQTAIDAMDRYIEQVVAICDAVGSKRRSTAPTTRRSPNAQRTTATTFVSSSRPKTRVR